jgi:hypothetical protein
VTLVRFQRAGMTEAILVHQSLRKTVSVAAAVAAAVTTLGAVVTIQPSGVASADVCASAGRRIYVSGCVDVAGAVDYYAPPPAYYAPLPEDFAPPPPPPPPLPNVTACVGATGRRGHVTVSGCN